DAGDRAGNLALPRHAALSAVGLKLRPADQSSFVQRRPSRRASRYRRHPVAPPLETAPNRARILRRPRSDPVILNARLEIRLLHPENVRTGIRQRDAAEHQTVHGRSLGGELVIIKSLARPNLFSDKPIQAIELGR